MALSLRNEGAERLAREVAKESGESITQSIIHAPENQLQRLRGQRTAADIFQRIMEISRRCSSLADEDRRSAEEILHCEGALLLIRDR